MGRVEKFKQMRALRHKYFISVIIFVTLLTAGICVADYSVNSLLGVDGGLKVFSVNNSDNKLEIIFMNQQLHFNMEYLNKDMGKLRQFLADIFGKGS